MSESKGQRTKSGDLHRGSARRLPVLERSEAEFRGRAASPPEEATRRDFFRLGAAGMALAGIGACGRPPEEKIIPYNEAPPELLPGIPQYYATSMVLDGFATGVLVESHVGRPTKIEGNPEHPASLGGTGVYEQASVLGVYDPDRADRFTRGGVPTFWTGIVEAIGKIDPSGRGLRFVLEPTSSPTTSRLLDQLRERHPEARFTFYAPLRSGTDLEAARNLYGRPLQPIYDFLLADRIVALDADVLVSMPFHLRYSREFAARRRLQSERGEMPRLYVAEPKPTPTGTLADHRLGVQASTIALLATALLGEIAGAQGLPIRARDMLEATPIEPKARRWVQAAARDLQRFAGRSVVVVGPRQPWQVHAIAHLINARLGNLGKTVRLIESTLYSAGEQELEMADLVQEIREGEVDHLVIAGANPIYTLPPRLDLAAALEAAPNLTSIYVGDHVDETAAVCEWMIPRLHYLESWGDARAYDGTVSFIQPLISPLREGKTIDQVLAVFLGEPRASDHQILRSFWEEQWGANLDVQLEAALHRGFIPDSALPAVTVSPRALDLTGFLESLDLDQSPGQIEASFYADPGLYDGRFATNPWLQELPDPQTKLTWGNAVLMGAALMRELGIDSGRAVKVTVGDQEVAGAALLLPGMAPRTVALHYGYGRWGIREDWSLGFNAFPLRPASGADFVSGVTVTPLEEEEERLAQTQEHFWTRGRDIALHATLQELHEHPHMAEHLRGPVEHLFLPEQEQHSPQWGMVIDQTICHGCSACVVACQAENNIPVVGKEGVLDAREMHWLRIDRYYHGGIEDPVFINQPMLCQHCEYAPCEYVCPVNATVHDPDGLNNMIYNRCIGTRFCSNNCPWKVRRFNWFDYVERTPRNLQKNPNVTVRERGVMEKCTYCVQRIRRAEIDARRQGLPVGTIEVETACQQACPTHAISFGDLTDPRSEVRTWWELPHRYAVLHETGAQPRTQYLVKLTNPVDEEA